MNLYTIDSEYISLLQMLEDNDGEITEDIASLLDSNDNILENKLKNYTYILKNIEGDINAIDTEIKRLSALKSSKTKSTKVMEDAISNSLKLRGIDKFDGGTFKLSFRKSTQLIIDDETKVPKKFLKVSTTIDKLAIKAIYNTGKSFEWAHLQENNNIQIK